MKKILVLDDNADILDIVQEVLTYEHFTVKTFSYCAGFLDEALNFLPDVVLLDYRLNDGNGADLCRLLKTHPKLKHIPVILFSAYFLKDVDVKKLGCDAVILKPFDIE
ncbi:response regulator [Mucilaginibacter sp. BT774]|uniref:response regulator n=1 Tax=Mucilaginibacter sp. BT774 TaxID=3062276 RepID=UPI002675D3AD|nr:response regulator [Mucilaginibacter sp. BT774]MDO3627613.1 response regulator [Mucilaginibacter sp. BT774]